MGRPPLRHATKRRSLRAKGTTAAQIRWGKETTTPTTSPSPTQKKMTGSRIMSVENLLTSIATISGHGAKCTGVCRMVQEVRREGLASVFMVQCDKCEEKFHIYHRGQWNQKNEACHNKGAEAQTGKEAQAGIGCRGPSRQTRVPSNPKITY